MTAHVVERGLKDASADVIVFFHGWPDTDEVFAKQYAAFEKTHRLISIVIPGYAKGDKIPFFGIEFTDVASMMLTALKEALKNRPNKARKPQLVCHDWGAVIAREMLYREPNLFERCVFLDIGAHSGQPTAVEGLITVAYQWTLVVLYLLPAFLSNVLSAFVARILAAPPRTVAGVRGQMNYLYLRIWRGVLTKSLPPSFTRWCVPNVPILFLYGSRKPLRFHSQRFLDYLEKTPGCKAKAYPAGHWFFVGRHAADVNSEIATFLAAKL